MDWTTRNELLEYGLSRWKLYHEQKQQEWREKIIITTKMNHLSLQNTIRYWYEWSHEKCHNQNTKQYKHINKTMNRIKLKRYLKHWHQSTNSIYEHQKMCIKASAYHSIQQQHETISKWKEITQKKLMTLQKYETFTQQKQSQMIEKYFKRWKTEKELKHILIKTRKLLNAYANRLYLIHTFQVWRDQYKYIKIRNDVADKFHNFKLKKYIFCAFKINTKNNKQCHQKIDEFISLRLNPQNNQQNELQIAYIHWKNRVNHINSIKYNLQLQIKDDMMHWWQKYNLKKQKLEYFENKIKTKHNQLKLRRIFIEWKLLIKGIRQNELFSILRYLQFWYKLTKQSHTNKSKYIALRHWINLKKMNQIWLHWFLVTQDQIELREKINISVNFYDDKIKVSMFTSWKKHIAHNKNQKRLSKKVKNMHKKGIKKRAFYHWYSIFHQHQNEEKMTNMALTFLMTKYIQCWLKKTKLSKKKRFDNYKSRLFHTKCYFNKWLQIFEPFKIGFEYEKQITMSIKPYIHSRNKKILSSALNIWYEEMTTKYMRHRAQCKEIKRYFKAWKKLLKSQKKLVKSFKKERNFRLKNEIFSNWITLCIHKKEERDKFVLATKYADTIIERKIFMKWRKYVETEEMVYCWNESIVLGIVDDVMDTKYTKKENIEIIMSECKDNEESHEYEYCTGQSFEINDKLHKIECLLKDLLHQKLEFKQKCRAFVNIQNSDNTKQKKNASVIKLENDIVGYITKKSQRKQHVLTILNSIENVYKYYQK